MIYVLIRLSSESLWSRVQFQWSQERGRDLIEVRKVVVVEVLPSLLLWYIIQWLKLKVPQRISICILV
jgi:hypothetical protein